MIVLLVHILAIRENGPSGFESRAVLIFSRTEIYTRIFYRQCPRYNRRHCLTKRRVAARVTWQIFGDAFLLLEQNESARFINQQTTRHKLLAVDYTSLISDFIARKVTANVDGYRGDNAFVWKDGESTNRLAVEFHYYYKSTRENYWNVTWKKKPLFL